MPFRIMSLLESIILGVVQGITEFLPVSSSAHLALLGNFFGIEDKLQVTIFMHFGSILALIVVMWKDIKKIILKEHRIILLLIIGSIPAGILGFAVKDIIESAFNSPYLIGVALVITGLILWFTLGISARGGSAYGGKERNVGIPPRRDDLSLLNAFLIGLAQGIAIIPGISRSGFTIATGIYLGNNRMKVAKFSLLLGIISICGATFIEAIDLFKRCSQSGIQYPVSSIWYLVSGILISFAASYFAIKLLLRVVKTNTFAYFAFYCWAVGFLAIIFST